MQEFVIPTGKPFEQTTGGGVGRQVQEIGFELAVTPTVQKNNQIHLQLNPKVTQFDGFVESVDPPTLQEVSVFRKGYLLVS